jgi:hypothetical protein
LVSSDSDPLVEARYSRFLSLLIPTIVAIAVLVADKRQLKFTGIYNLVTENRASTSIAVQIVATTLSLIQIEAVNQLFSLATRLHLRKAATTLGLLQFWNGVRSRTIKWKLEPKLFVVLCIYLLCAAIPAAIWTGALTPVITSEELLTTTRIPQYSNMSLLKEWPSEIGRSGPSLRNTKGFFTYSIGVQYADLLTQTLSTATTIDGSPRHHIKFDNSDFLYVGRSFGVGSSVGLIDDTILNNPLAQSYRYQESGYASRVSCSYNNSIYFFHISPNPVDNMLYAATGYLPDSTAAEYSVYVGHSPDAIVAFGVAAQPVDMSLIQYVGIAAGTSYQTLNGTQCKLEFIPSMFDVAVNILSKNITISHTATAVNGTSLASTPDIDPSNNLTHVVARQIELYSNDLTNIYQSVIGNALNSSISDLQSFINQEIMNSSTSSWSPSNITLTAIENSITAMLDDILVGYASAQLMIANDSAEVPAIITVPAVYFGKSIYIYLVIGINMFVLLLVIEEAIRTKGWKDSSAFDYADLAHIAIASSRGGNELAESIEAIVAQADKNCRRDAKVGEFMGFVVPSSRSETQIKIQVRDHGKEGSNRSFERFELSVAEEVYR